MASFDRGTKRQCQHCSTKFYDLNRDPILCPSCGEKFLLVTERLGSKSGNVAEVVGAGDASVTEDVAPEAAAVEAGAEVISLNEVEVDDDSDDSDDEDIPEVEDVEVDDAIGADEKDVFLEDDDDDDDIKFDVKTSDED